MASDYDEIRANNERRYGTDIGRYGKDLLVDRYDDRTHFIYELLQNAEDALHRRNDKPWSRTIRFELFEHALHISHYGKPFDQLDVEGVCGIASSTRGEDITRIGRFGIGFKSVYAFTDRPEIHSGNEDFGIENFVLPWTAQPIEREPDQTIFIMPLRNPDKDSKEIAKGLRSISLDTLLFLRKIDAIEWKLPDGQSSTYVQQSEPRDNHVRRVKVIGSRDQDEIEGSWLVFSKSIELAGSSAGDIEVAFSMEDGRIKPVSRSPLAVFFPTVLETYLGFLTQGPYRTTPSRDNVPKGDEWNQECVKKTGDVLVDALVWLRDHDRLDVNVLECLPIDNHKFDESNMFTPVYESVKNALCNQNLLPVFGKSYTTASSTKLARSHELRKLFDHTQLSFLLKTEQPMSWLTDIISQNRTPNLYKYITEDLDIDEITPQTMLSKLDISFLSNQSNEWIQQLYEFLASQRALHQQAKNKPIIRLSDGTHVAAFIKEGDIPQAFLPSSAKTEFPTVHEEICQSENAKQFLRMIGLSEPDPIDDIIWNVLPKYNNKDFCISDSKYTEDIDRILKASQTEKSDKRNELIQYLKQTRFVRAVNTSDDSVCFSFPDECYLPTDRLVKLFSGIPGIQIIDNRCDAFRHNDVRNLLESCGVSRYLRPIKKEYEGWNCPLSRKFLADLRERNGQSQTSNKTDAVTDWILIGLDNVLEQLPSLDIEGRRIKAQYIWEELAQIENQIGKGIFHAEYRWTYYKKYRQEFDSAFIRQLINRAWIPDQSGELQRPALMLFQALNWYDNPFLRSKIGFKLPTIDRLAAEAGFEPKMLDILKDLGITKVSDLMDHLDITSVENSENLGSPSKDENEISIVNSMGDPLNTPDISKPTQSMTEDLTAIPIHPDRTYEGSSMQVGNRRSGSSGYTQKKDLMSAPSPSDTRFISYVVVDQESSTDDLDGLVHEERTALEEAAIALILNHDQAWQRTPTNNPGFDLFKIADGRPYSWCEVKAMKGDLQGRPVGLSRKQFEYAQARGKDYWLYVVEHAGQGNARIVRIQDPAGKAKTFTFDKGWLDVAEFD